MSTYNTSPQNPDTTTLDTITGPVPLRRSSRSRSQPRYMVSAPKKPKKSASRSKSSPPTTQSRSDKQLYSSRSTQVANPAFTSPTGTTQAKDFDVLAFLQQPVQSSSITYGTAFQHFTWGAERKALGKLISLEGFVEFFNFQDRETADKAYKRMISSTKLGEVTVKNLQQQYSEFQVNYASQFWADRGRTKDSQPGTDQRPSKLRDREDLADEDEDDEAELGLALIAASQNDSPFLPFIQCIYDQSKGYEPTLPDIPADLDDYKQLALCITAHRELQAQIEERKEKKTKYFRPSGDTLVAVSGIVDTDSVAMEQFPFTKYLKMQ
ncbi:hypothetical protein BGZ81_003964, partial [Podila clonocystis]